MQILPRFRFFFGILLMVILLAGCSAGEKEQTGIDSGEDRDSVQVEMVAQDSISALQLLLDLHEVEYQPSLMGAFVQSIDSVENSSDAFWVYSVNDTTPKIASDKLILNPGDRLVWHLRKVGTESVEQ